MIDKFIAIKIDIAVYKYINIPNYDIKTAYCPYREELVLLFVYKLFDDMKRNYDR